VRAGAQPQRACCAKRIVAQPRLLILDEPTTGVDADAQDALAALLARLHGELRATILYVSHEFGAVEHVAERLLLVRGGIAFDGSPAQLPERWHDPSHAHAWPRVHAARVRRRRRRRRARAGGRLLPRPAADEPDRRRDPPRRPRGGRAPAPAPSHTRGGGQ